MSGFRQHLRSTPLPTPDLAPTPASRQVFGRCCAGVHQAWCCFGQQELARAGPTSKPNALGRASFPPPNFAQRWACIARRRDLAPPARDLVRNPIRRNGRNLSAPFQTTSSQIPSRKRASSSESLLGKLAFGRTSERPWLPAGAHFSRCGTLRCSVSVADCKATR